MQYERPKKIIRRLYQHLDEILNNNKLQIVIDCAGNNIKVKRTLHDD